MIARRREPDLLVLALRVEAEPDRVQRPLRVAREPGIERVRATRRQRAVGPHALAIDMHRADMASLARMTSLATLSLDRTLVGDAGVAELVGLSRLADLGLDTTQVTDRALAALSRLHLRHIDLRHTRVTRAGATRLQRQLGGELDWGGRPVPPTDLWMMQ